jgi:hypothetical protein
MNAVPFLKSKIVWVQILAALSILVAQYGQFGFMNPQLAMFISFALTAILQQFGSYKPIAITGVSKDKTMFWANVVAAGLMITDYFLQNQVFQACGVNANMIGMFMITINLVLRTYFTNQPSEEVRNAAK